jgi:hypothetical protein
MRHLMTGVSSAALLMVLALVGPAFAWSEQNCKSECASRMPSDVAACIAQYRCSQYRGGKQIKASQQKAATDAWNTRQSK